MTDVLEGEGGAEVTPTLRNKPDRVLEAEDVASPGATGKSTRLFLEETSTSKSSTKNSQTELNSPFTLKRKASCRSLLTTQSL